jgi:hypothetical protein
MPTCTPHARKRPTNAARLVLHAGQQAVHRDRTRFRVVVAGRRWGKTQLARAELIVRALARDGRYWYVAPTFKDAKDIFWADLKAAIDWSWLAEKPNETELRVLLRSGGEIRLFGADDPDSLRGRGLRFVVLDEFADMKPEAWTQALRPALADYRAPALFIGTPRSFNHFHALYERGQDPTRPHWSSWQFRTIENPFIDPDEIEEAKADADARTFRQEYEASFETLSGRAYYAFARAHNVSTVALDPNLPACLFFDFNVDPATAGIGQRQGDHAAVYREVRLTHRGGEATRATALRVRDLLREVGHHGQVRVYGDATGKSAKTTGPADHAVIRDVFPTARLVYLRGEPARERPRVGRQCASANRWRCHHRLVVDPSCTGLIADLEQVIYAANGELDKKSNPMLTHHSDGLGYWIAKDFPIVSIVRAGAMSVDWLN